MKDVSQRARETLLEFFPGFPELIQRLMGLGISGAGPTGLGTSGRGCWGRGISGLNVPGLGISGPYMKSKLAMTSGAGT